MTASREGIHGGRNGTNGNGGAKDGITRRDFLDGVAISAAGLRGRLGGALPDRSGGRAGCARTGSRPTRCPPGYYPPTSTGITGEPNGVVANTMRIDPASASPADIHSAVPGPGIGPSGARDVDDDYDCVIVGAGASGLAAAKYYRDRFGRGLEDPPDRPAPRLRRQLASQRVPRAGRVPRRGGRDDAPQRRHGQPRLDRRVEQAAGRPDGHPGRVRPARGEHPRLGRRRLRDRSQWTNGGAAGIPGSFGLRSMLLFPAADFGTDSVIQSRTEPNTAAGWTTFMNRTPYSAAARAAIIAIQTSNVDVMVAKDGPMTQDEKIQRLTQMTYKQYLQHYWELPRRRVPRRVLARIRKPARRRRPGGRRGRLLGARAARLPVSALDLGDTERHRVPRDRADAQQDAKSANGPTRAWPDGNISLLELIVAKLIPAAQPDVNGARPTQTTILQSKTDYSQLDVRGNTVRIRLNSTVVDVKPGVGKRDLAKLVYLTPEKKAERVRAKHVVMACWNRVTARHRPRPSAGAGRGPLLRPEGAADLRARALNNWQAFADARVEQRRSRGHEPLLGHDERLRGRGLRAGGRAGLRADAEPAAELARAAHIPGRPQPARRDPQLYAYGAGAR